MLFATEQCPHFPSLWLTAYKISACKARRAGRSCSSQETLLAGISYALTEHGDFFFSGLIPVACPAFFPYARKSICVTFPDWDKISVRATGENERLIWLCVSNGNIFGLIFFLLFKEFWLIFSNFCFHGFCDDKDYLNAVGTARENVQYFKLYICSGFPVVARDLPKLWIHKEFPRSPMKSHISYKFIKKEKNKFFFCFYHTIYGTNVTITQKVAVWKVLQL